MKPRRIAVVFGTRPEAIKMAPVVRALKLMPELFDVRVIVTAQHRRMLDQVLHLFQIQPDVDLDLMKPGQNLADLTSRLILAMNQTFEQEKPDIVLVHGDTTTAMSTSLAAFYLQIPLGHVEAGLRTRNKHAPFPEEINRQIVGLLSDLHFTPTEVSKTNLLQESVKPSCIHVTGNTVVDALHWVVERLQKDSALTQQLNEKYAFLRPSLRTILITGHRRENFGIGFESICQALADLVQAHQDIELIYPVHLNPNVQEPVYRILGSHRDRVHLIEPLEYLPFVYLLNRCHFVITDSGGIQEEAPALGKPVLVMRETTERPEAVAAGTVRLIGSDRRRIFQEATRLLTDSALYDKMKHATSPYGDGHAATKIAHILRSHFERP